MLTQDIIYIKIYIKQQSTNVKNNIDRSLKITQFYFYSDVTSEDLPLGQYFVYKLISTQKDFGYRKLLRTDLIAEVSFKTKKTHSFPLILGSKYFVELHGPS